MLFRQLFDPATSTWTYLLADTDAREAVLIDPVREQAERDATILEELGLRLVSTLETHVHADHVTGAWVLKQKLGSAIAYPATSGVNGADRLLDEGDVVRFGRYALEVRLTPGHTDGCATYVLDDQTKAFTGDALLIHGSGRTDFQQGDARRLYRSVRDQIFSLPDETEVYPGHDYKGRTVTTVAEEKRFNPRLGMGNTEDQFVAIMAKLDLAYPRFIDRALPANLNLGREAGDVDVQPAERDLFATLPRSPSGVLHATPAWVAENCGRFRLVDVRETYEWNGDLGHIEGAQLVPLGTLGQEAAKWDPAAPVVLVCRSSGRSDRAAHALERAGFTRVASMVGGMLAWRREDRREACL
ncbi:MAG: MBL fold metallo-hydrolase [Myxococcales bacterium]|nr:MBL fold metallo-hydrolase [Myxococcales bacterium]